MVPLVERLRLVLIECVRKDIVPLLGREATARWRFAGFFRTGNPDLTSESGITLTPSGGAELIPTPAAPNPWSSRI